MPVTTPNAVLIERIDTLRADLLRLEGVIGQIESVLVTMKDLVTEFRVGNELRHGEIVKSVEKNEAKIILVEKAVDNLDTKVVTIDAKVTDLEKAFLQNSQILRWTTRLFWLFVSSFLLGTGSFIWGVISHKIILNFN